MEQITTKHHAPKNVNAITVDWLRISFDPSSWKFACALFDIDYTAQEWADTNKYMKNYGTMAMDGVFIGAEALPTVVNGDMEIEGRFIVDFTGNGLGVYFEQNPTYTVANLLRMCLEQEDARVLRIDIAFDDYNGYLDIMGMAKMLQQSSDVSRVITRWRGWELRMSGEMFSDDAGTTLYIGSRSSNSFGRVYDKRAQLMATEGFKPAALPPSWIRFELEIKSKKAHAVAEAAMKNNFNSSYFAGVLRGLIEFKEGKREDHKKANMKTARWWSKFLNDSEAVSVRVPLPVASIEKKKEWLSKSVATTLALVQHHYEGDMQFIHDLLANGDRRLTPAHLALLNSVDTHGA